MGIGWEVHEFEKKVIRVSGQEWQKISMCELGNQKIKFLAKRIPAKKYYRELGVRAHVSLDLNRKNGARRVNLNNPVPEDLIEQFDLVTDYGTLEHINNQYRVFRNMHDMCKTGGMMLHSLPPPEHWPGHGRYYYPEGFFLKLAKLCSYTFIVPLERQSRDNREKHDMLLVAFRKLKAGFPSEEMFDKLPLVDSGDLSTTGNYTQKTRSLLYKLLGKE